MPEFLDNPKALTMKALIGLPKDDPRLKAAMDSVESMKGEFSAKMQNWHSEIQARFEWFDGSITAYTRLFALLSIKLGKPIDWFDEHLDYGQLIAILNEIPSYWVTVKRTHLIFKKTKLNEMFQDHPDKIRRCADQASAEISREMKGAWIGDSWQENYP